MTHMAEEERPLELMRLIEEAEGSRVISALRTLSWSLYTFDGNVQELDQVIQELEGPQGLMLAALENRDLLDATQRELARLLHNVVSAAKSLVDHTRILSRDLYARDSTRGDDYQARINDDFKTDPLSQFVNGLRQYCLHYRLPFIGFTLSFSRTGPGFDTSQTFFLNKESLQGFDWTASARAYLEQCPDRIEFHSVMNDYQQKVHELYEWFWADIQDLYQDELDRLRELEDEYSILELRAQLAFWDLDLEMSDAERVDNLFMTVLETGELAQIREVAEPRHRLEAAMEVLDARLTLPEDLRAQLLDLLPDSSS